MEQLHCLKNQKFSDNEPGTLLKDFASLLDFIGSSGIPVSNKNHLVAIKLLPQLNQLMSHPLNVTLTRPQQKSYPQINGLYLLLRASGLATIVSEKKETKLLLNNKILASWNSMNPTERYFALFHAWWHRGSDEIVGERPERFSKNYFDNSLYSFLNILRDGLDVKKNLHDLTSLRYSPGLHNLALMELFGFVRIEQDAALNKDNWPIVKIEPTAWGRALLNYFSKYATFNNLFDEAEGNQQTEPWGYELKAYIPDWKKSLLQPDAVVIKNGVVIIKVNLGNVYRKMAVPTDISLDYLADSILKTFNFDNDHLYEFVFKNAYGITERIVHPYIEEHCGVYTSECVFGELPLYQGMELMFRFDFGDDWRFMLLVESISTEDKRFPEPKVIERHGKAPEQYPEYD